MPAVNCAHCQGSYPLAAAPGWTEGPCPLCQERLQVFAFPALERPLAAVATAKPAHDGQASCFFHAHKPAAVPCDACGRFLCDLCDFRFQDRHYCASCLGSAQSGEGASVPETAGLIRERVYLPQIAAWSLAFYGPLTLFGLYLIPFTAPASIWISIRHWKNREGFQVRGQWRFVGAIILSLLEIGGMAALTVFITLGIRSSLKK
jgi:hypothetical protein